MSDRRLRIRRPALNLVGASGGVLFALVGLGYLTDVTKEDILEIVFGVVFIAAGAWFFVRLLRAGVILSEEGLRIRSLFRTRSVRWDEYKRAIVVESTGPIPAAVLQIELNEGRPIRVEEVRSFGWVESRRPRFIERAIAQIEEFRRGPF